MKKYEKVWEVIKDSFIGISAYIWLVYYVYSFSEYIWNHYTCCLELYELLFAVSLICTFTAVCTGYIDKYYTRVKNWIKTKRSEDAA